MSLESWSIKNKNVNIRVEEPGCKKNSDANMMVAKINIHPKWL